MTHDRLAPVDGLFAQGMAVWHMGPLVAGGRHPLALQAVGEVGPSEDLQGAARDESLARGGGGSARVFGGGGWYRGDPLAAQALRPTANAFTLQARVWLGEPDGQGTVFFSDSLGLAVAANGLAIAFLGEAIPSGVVLRELPLALLERGGWLDLLLRVGEGRLELFCDGRRLASAAIAGALRRPCACPLTIGAFGWGPAGEPNAFFRGKMDHLALWDRALADGEVALLAGLQALRPGREPDAASRALDAYQRFFDAAVRLDVEGCQREERLMREFMDQDPCRPIYHLTAPMGWMYDPAGAYYHAGRYHVSTYRNLYNILRYCSLDRYVSDDLVYWRQWAVWPWADSDLDVCGIWLNNHFIDDQGLPNIIYTAYGASGLTATKVGVRARSHDGLLSFGDKKAVLTDYHHDGHTWKEGDTWYTLTTRQYGGSRPGDTGDALMLWSSSDLDHWTEVGEVFSQKKDAHTDHPLAAKGFMEFPYLLPFGEVDVLLLGGFPVRYWIGHLDRRTWKFVPHHADGLLLDYTNGFHCYNPLIVDGKGPGGTPRRVILAMEPRAHGVYGRLPWNGAHAMPRSLALDGGHLRQDPLPEFQALRGAHHSRRDIRLTPQGSAALPWRGDALEICAEFEPGDARLFGLKVRVSDDGNTFVRVYFDAATGEYGVDGNRVPTSWWVPELAPDLGRGPTFLPRGSPVQMRVFLDKCLVEAFVNGQTCTTVLQNPDPRHAGLELFCEGGGARCTSLDVWEMRRARS
jgi:sucrose-6-phosphate hydrolase SacC (GH32 family)